MKLNRLASVVAIIFIITMFLQCKKNDDDVPPIVDDFTITDQQLYDMSITTTGYTYYKDDPTVLRSSPQSAHKAFFRVRFNNKAQAALTDNGKLPAGGVFPEGSIIVKELLSDSSASDLSQIAVMMKASGDQNADDLGWVWAEYFGSVDNKISVNDKGVACISCHSTNHRDRVRIFNLVP